MNFTTLCFFLLLLAAGTAAQPVSGTFYIDPADGNDNANGTSEGTPWQSYRNRTFSPGSVILFKRGTVIRDALYTQDGSDAGYITFGAYGQGPKPVFMGSVPANDAGKWTVESGNVWRYADGFSSAVCNIVFNEGDHAGNLRWIMEDLDEQGEWFYENDVLYLYSAENPASFYSDIEVVLWGQRKMAGGKQYVILENLVFKNGGVHGYQDSDAHHITIRDCEFRFIGGGVFDYAERVRFGNGIELWNSGHDILVERCIFDNIYDSGVTHQGHEIHPFYNIWFWHNIFTNNGMAAYEYRAPGAYDVYFENNTCINTGGGFSMQGETPPRESEIHPEPMGHSVFIWLIVNEVAGNVFIRNNIFYEAPYGSAIYCRVAPNIAAQIVIDHNLYWQTTGTSLVYMNQVDYTPAQFTAYQAATGKDAHSLVAEPGFVDAVAGDYHLSAGSPAIYGGITTGRTSDFDLVPVPQNTVEDMGAFHYPEPPAVVSDKDLALSSKGATAEADGELTSETPNISEAIDAIIASRADFSNRWHSSIDTEHPHWIQVNLAAPSVIDSIKVHFADRAGYPVSFQGMVKASAADDWQTVFDVTDNGERRVYVAEIGAQQVLSFRLVIRSSANDAYPNAAQVSEIEMLESTASATEKMVRGFAGPSAVPGIFIDYRNGEPRLIVGSEVTANEHSNRLFRMDGRIEIR
jgi:hypothetical protein